MICFTIAIVLVITSRYAALRAATLLLFAALRAAALSQSACTTALRAVALSQSASTAALRAAALFS